MKKFFVPLFLTTAFLFACKKSDSDVTKSISLNDSFSLKIGQTAELETDGMTITFVDVTEDSRCPTNVECVWEGRVVILLNVEKDGETIVKSLTDNPNNDPTLSTSFAAFGHTVSLEEVTPYPEDTTEIEQADYTAKLKVE